MCAEDLTIHDFDKKKILFKYSVCGRLLGSYELGIKQINLPRLTVKINGPNACTCPVMQRTTSNKHSLQKDKHTILVSLKTMFFISSQLKD